MFVQNSDVVAGDFAACECVDVAAYGVAFDGDLARRSIARAFKQGVFDESERFRLSEQLRVASPSAPILPTVRTSRDPFVQRLL